MLRRARSDEWRAPKK